VRVPRGRSLWTVTLDSDGPGAGQGTILDEVRRVILDGDAPPGTRIAVDDVAEFFGVSRIPVREALKTLIAEGLVSQRPRSDYIVAQLARSELEEFYTVRGVLELATLGPAVAAATAEDDTVAVDAYEALARAVRDGDVRGHHRESRRFHFALLNPSGMGRMLHMLDAAWNMTEPVQPMSFAGPLQGEQFHGDHRCMLDAFIARDAQTLIESAREHHAHLQAMIAALPHRSGLFIDE
jgi:DNA-binding GntR family transcriptional regulator